MTILEHPDAKRQQRRRELARERKRRQRKREQAVERFYRVGVSPAVLAALVLRSIDGGMSEPEAERAALDRRKVSADLSELVADWAQRYAAKRDRA